MCFQSNDPYLPPEMNPRCVRGKVHGHPTREDGSGIMTSAITKVEGKTVITASGSRYTLGEPRPEYVAWLAEQGRKIDPDNPIKVIKD